MKLDVDQGDSRELKHVYVSNEMNSLNRDLFISKAIKKFRSTGSLKSLGLKALNDNQLITGTKVVEISTQQNFHMNPNKKSILKKVKQEIELYDSPEKHLDVSHILPKKL